MDVEMQRSWRTNRRSRADLFRLTIAGSILGILFISCYRGWRPRTSAIISPVRNQSTSSPVPPLDVTLVVASQKADNITWLQAFPSWTKWIYVTDDQAAPLTVPANKGREGMVYLTHIIDNYDTLTGIMIFSHSNRYQWHNDDPLYDGQQVLSSLRLPYVESQGYVNLRCAWILGCPAEIHPLDEAEAPTPASDPTSKEARAGSFYKSFFEEMFPDSPVPEVIGVACCAQFAVTAHQIRMRPRSDYERLRSWLVQTPLQDHLSGRIMEYSWHMIFGQAPVFCPTASECYCKLFGLCNLECEGDDSCDSVYTLPRYSTFPQGWPEVDLNGNDQDATDIRLKFDKNYELRNAEDAL